MNQRASFNELPIIAIISIHLINGIKKLITMVNNNTYSLIFQYLYIFNSLLRY